MLNITRDDVVTRPFPHVVKDGILPADLFEKLKADFPRSDIFVEQFAETGSTGSRVGAGTGFDIYRGDASYDRLIASSSAWSEFDAYINSVQFVEKFLDVFGPDLEILGFSAQIDSSAYDRNLIEGREVLTQKKSVTDTVRKIGHRFFGQPNTPPPLFSRLDIEKSVGGYAKPPHCDRENRLCSLIIYFTDMEREEIDGGELNIYAHKESKLPSAHERHPKPASVEVVATLKPRENLGVFFPCSNNSYHGVNAIRTEGKSRNFLYINISTTSPSCW